MRSFALFTTILVSLMFLATFSQEDIQKSRVLVLLDSLAIKDTHSLFFQDLRSNKILFSPHSDCWLLDRKWIQLRI